MVWRRFLCFQKFADLSIEGAALFCGNKMVARYDSENGTRNTPGYRLRMRRLYHIPVPRYNQNRHTELAEALRRYVRLAHHQRQHLLYSRGPL